MCMCVCVCVCVRARMCVVQFPHSAWVVSMSPSPCSYPQALSSPLPAPRSPPAQVTSKDTINGMKLDWAFGAILYEINALPYEYVGERCNKESCKKDMKVRSEEGRMLFQPI